MFYSVSIIELFTGRRLPQFASWCLYYLTSHINQDFKMSMLASMSKQSDGLGLLQVRLMELQPTKTISGERSSWYHDYTDWAYTGGLT